MVTNSYLGEYVVDINTPLIFSPQKIKIRAVFLNEDNPHVKTPSLVFPPPPFSLSTGLGWRSHPPELSWCLSRVLFLFSKRFLLSMMMLLIYAPCPKPTHLFSVLGSGRFDWKCEKLPVVCSVRSTRRLVLHTDGEVAFPLGFGTKYPGKT